MHFSQLYLTFFIGLFISIGFSPLALADNHVDLSDVGEVFLENNGSAEAQQAFLHGLAQMHNFEYSFAADDFREAQRLDPDFALAYWGEAMTYNHPIWMMQDKDSALEVLDRYAPSPAARQDKAPTELGRDLFAAADILYGNGDKEDRDDLYMAHMARLYARYPDNVEIAAQYALSIMGTAHEGREFGLYMQSAAITQNFINDYPRHPGVAHYLIHATDDPVHAPLGLKAANAYGMIAPNAGHALHMTSHIFLALGDWEKVIHANSRALAIINANRAEKGKDPSGCGHYPSWLMYGYLQQGERDAAHDIMMLCHENVAANPGKPSYYYVWQRMLYLLDSGEWSGDVAGMKADFSDNYASLFQDQITDGWVALEAADIPGARVILKDAHETFSLMEQKWDDEGISEGASERQEPVVSLMQLESKILLASGETDAALDLLNKTVALEMDLPFGFGPPRPAKPSLELLGETLSTLGENEQALAILNSSLSRTPNKLATVAALAALNTKMASLE